jgi:hypothetical protein
LQTPEFWRLLAAFARFAGRRPPGLCGQNQLANPGLTGNNEKSD